MEINSRIYSSSGRHTAIASTSHNQYYMSHQYISTKIQYNNILTTYLCQKQNILTYIMFVTMEYSVE